jgi:hypothetical protein
MRMLQLCRPTDRRLPLRNDHERMRKTRRLPKGLPLRRNGPDSGEIKDSATLRFTEDVEVRSSTIESTQHFLCTFASPVAPPQYTHSFRREA